MLATTLLCVFLFCNAINPSATAPHGLSIFFAAALLMFYELIDRQSERTTFANANKDDAKAG